MKKIRELQKKILHSKRTRLILLSIIVGVIAGIGATVLYGALYFGKILFLNYIIGYNPQAPGGEVHLIEQNFVSSFSPLLLLIIPAIGGLISGILTYTFAPEVAGHGTDAAIDNFHNKGADVKLRTPFFKLLTSFFTISTGGSGGQEGPIAQIGSGLASNIAKGLGLSTEERRLLMAAGMAGGIGAIFGAPMAGAIFAA